MFTWFIPRRVSLLYGWTEGVRFPCWYFTDGETNLENLHGLAVTTPADAADPDANTVVANGRYYRFGKQQRELYRTFAQLPTEKPPFGQTLRQAYLDFAQQYGLLGRDLQTAAQLELPLDTTSPPNEIYMRAEPLLWWMGEISQMQGALALYKALTRADVDFLRVRINWFPPMHKGLGELIGMYNRVRDSQVIHVNDEDRWSLRVMGEMLYDYPYLNGAPTDEDYLSAGQRHLNLWIMQGLIGRTRAALWPDEKGTLTVATQPNSLIGQLWFQFATSVARQHQVKHCPVCGKGLIILNRAASRDDKTYCSSACRQRAYRQRRKTKNLKSCPKHQVG